MERNMYRLEQYSCCECIEIAGVPNSITNDLLEEHIILIFIKLGVIMEQMDIVTCHRLAETDRVLFNWDWLNSHRRHGVKTKRSTKRVEPTGNV